MGNNHVTIGTVHLDKPGWAYTESMVRMIGYDMGHGQHLMHESGVYQSGAFMPIWGRGGDMAHFRNSGAAMFLQSDSDWLLWIDSDMGFPANAVEVLMETADPQTCPLIGGLCFIESNFAVDWLGGLKSRLSPTIYDWVFIEDAGYKLVSRHAYERNSVVECAATGTGFLLTHRSVFERISAWCAEGGIPENIWYQRIPGPRGEPTGEDVSFCMRATNVGIIPRVDTSLRISHQKTVWLTEPDFDHRPDRIAEANWDRLERSQWPILRVDPFAEQKAAAASDMGRLVE